MLDGQGAKTALYIAGILLAVLLFSYTVIIVEGKPVPAEFQGYGNILLGALVGFLAGSRVDTTEKTAAIKMEPLTPKEREVLKRDS